MIVLEILFWLSLGWIVYVLIGYPVLMYLLARLRPRPIRRDHGHLPRVCFVMAAYNEEKLIGAKLENYRELDYPRDRMRFMIGSDGSSDATDAIIEQHIARDGSISLTRYNRVGKTRIIYEIAERVDEEIIVFTDADIILERNALREIVACFADPEVGGVIGTMIHTDDGRNAGNVGQHKYQELEDWLRHSESLFGTTMGPRGECFAVRRGSYRPLYDNRHSDDTHLTISIPLCGYRVWFEPEVIYYETTRRTVASESRRRLRIGQQVAAIVLGNRETRYPWRSLIGFEIWSHKMLRNLLAVPIGLAVVTALLLGPLVGGGYVWVSWVAVLYCLFLVVGGLLDRLGVNIRPLQYPLYFSVMLASLTLGSFRAFRGGGLAMWTQSREESGQ